QNIRISQEKILVAPLGKYDLVAKVSNPNGRWIVKSFQYRFVGDNFETAWQDSFLANNEQKYLFYFGYESSSGSANLIGQEVDVEIRQIEYQRIKDPVKVPDVHFDIVNVNYDTLYLADSGETVSQVTAEITNNSVYSFWQVGFQIVMMANDQPISINYTTVDNFDTLLSKNLDVKWQARIAGVGSVEIVPDFNIIDNDNYKRYNIEL
ncbi:hypothetical protein KKI23_02500, partial [Patescibacteria group bacterium]|nr:hypothetical protein [Patescibacteria group bacterium]